MKLLRQTKYTLQQLIMTVHIQETWLLDLSQKFGLIKIFQIGIRKAISGFRMNTNTRQNSSLYMGVKSFAAQWRLYSSVFFSYCNV